MKAYHFVKDTLRDGTPIPKDGEWLEVPPPLEMCKRGLHASLHPMDACQYAPGPILCLVECEGEILHQIDKICCSRRKIIARFDATDLLRADARASALSVIDKWKEPVPDVVLRYLQTGDEAIRSAAWSAAQSAAESAWAARSAAWSAAESAARARLLSSIKARFESLGVTYDTQT